MIFSLKKKKKNPSINIMRIKNLDTRDISVIVQGPVVGSKNNKPENRLTEICLKSIRTQLPEATIILSTWEGSDTNGLDYDLLIENKDPGSNIMSNETGDYKANCFRQIVSSMNGLEKCSTKYALKIRTDLELKNNNFLHYFIDYNELPFDPDYKILQKRIVTLTTCNPYRRTEWPFNVCDWFFFGLTVDLKDIFDIPLVDKPFMRKGKDGEEHIMGNPYSTEQYIWISFLSKYTHITCNDRDDVSHDNRVLSEKYFANNCILLSARRAGIKWLKFPGGAYAQPPYRSNSGLYTFNEYKRILNTYANNKLFIVPNIFESSAYFIVYNVRFMIKNNFASLYYFTRKVMDKKNNTRMKEISK